MTRRRFLRALGLGALVAPAIPSLVVQALTRPAQNPLFRGEVGVWNGMTIHETGTGNAWLRVSDSGGQTYWVPVWT